MPFVSAGAYSREIDLSLYAETSTNTKLALAHTFNKGPIDTKTTVTNLDNLKSLFGEPIDPTVSSTACQGWFAAREYLRRGNQLSIVRVESSTTSAEYAAQSVPGSSDDTLATATDGATSIPATRTLTSATGDFVTDGVIVGDVLEVHEGGADDGFYVLVTVAATVLTIDRDWPTGSLNNQDFTVWSAQKEGGTNGVTSVAATREFTSSGSTFSTNGVAAGDILSIEEPSGSIGDNGFYLIESVDSETQVTVNRDWPEGGLTALDFTIYSSNSNGADGSTAVDGEFSSAGAKFQDHGVQAGDILYINDSVDDGDNGYYMISGLKSGSEDTVVEVNQATWTTGSLTGLTYKIIPGSVTFQGATKGTWAEGLRLYPGLYANDPLKFNLQTKNSDGSLSLETVYGMNRTSVATDMTDNSDYWTATVRSNRGEPVPGDYYDITGGDDGYTSILESDYITGLREYSNPEEVDIDILICPGISAQNVQDEIINLCEARADCIGIIDPPDWSSIDAVQEILDFQDGDNIRTTALNTSYAAIYWAWQQVYDEFHDEDVWIAPSGHIAAVFAHNDNVQAPWFAPSGLKRGKLIGSKDLRYSPDRDDRDILCPVSGNSGRINPIVNFTGVGIHVWGQKTLLNASSALNRVNVRRMLLKAEKEIAASARILAFDPNDEVLDREFESITEPRLDNILSKRGIREYRIVVATTDTDRDNNKSVYKLLIKPTKASEVIEVQFALTSQGADFQELVA